MRLILTRAVMVCLLLFNATMCFGEIAIIVHPDNDQMIDLKTVKKIFLSKRKTFKNGVKAMPIDLFHDDPIRKSFNKRVLEKSEAALNAYWSRMLFTSRGQPPQIVATYDELKLIIATNRNAIGYLDAAYVDDSVRVVLVIE